MIAGTSLVPFSQCDNCVAAVILPFTFTFYGQPFTALNAGSNGNLQFSSGSPDSPQSSVLSPQNSCLPSSLFNNAIFAHWDDLDTRTSITSTFTPGIYTSVSGAAPNRIFNIEWRACLYAGGACGGQVNFEARLYEAQSRFEVIYANVAGGGSGATVGSQKGTGERISQYACDVPNSLQPGLLLAFSLAAPPTSTRTNTPVSPTVTPTLTRTNTGTSTLTATRTPTAPPCGTGSNYVVAVTTTATALSGTTLVPGSRCDECTIPLSLPFTYNLYGQPYNSVIATDNGTLNFVSATNILTQTCLPNTAYDTTIFAYWEDLDIRAFANGCSGFVGGCGIFTSTTGTAPNRIFNVEWQGCEFANGGCNFHANFEVRLYEAQDRFDLVYLAPFNLSGSLRRDATVGVQRGTGAQFTSYSCARSGFFKYGTQLIFRPYTCGEATFTATPSYTPTLTGTITPTPFPTSCGPGSDYVIVPTSGATIVPGTSLVPGSQCDECVQQIVLPFTYNLYGLPFNSVYASSNGNLGFAQNLSPSMAQCLPDNSFTTIVFPYSSILDMTPSISPSLSLGIYTSISGTAPNRISNIEWRACLSQGPGTCAGYVNFEARLYEGQDKFELVYGQLLSTSVLVRVGVQRANGSPPYGSYTTYVLCNDPSTIPVPGLKLTFRPYTCGEATFTPSSTPTATRTRTSTNTPTFFLTPTPTQTRTSTRIGTITRTPTPTQTCSPLQIVVGPGDPGRPEEIAAAMHIPDSQHGTLNIGLVSANPKPKIPGEIQNPKSKIENPEEAPLAFEFDDGGLEDALGFGNPFGQYSDPALWLNRFTPPSASYPITIESIKIFWPMQTMFGVNDTLIGKHARLLLYGDPDGDGNPDNATLLFQQVVTITTHNTFQTYPVTANVPGPTGDVYIGFEDVWAARGYGPLLYSAARDTSPPSQARSWLAGMSDGSTVNIYNLGSNTYRGYPDGSNGPGNFMIRATGRSSLPGYCAPTFTPTRTATFTATPTATSTPCLVASVSGAITGYDPLQVGHLLRDGVPSSCLLPKPNPGLSSNVPVRYDAYTYANTTGGPACVTVSLNASACQSAIFSAAYLGSFDPSNPAANYLADMGASTNSAGSYSFSVPSGSTYTVVVHEVNQNAGCSAYIMTVTTRCETVFTATPTVTHTGTPTPAITPTAVLTSTRTNTPTNTPSASTPVLVGHVTWQGRPAQPNALQQVVITLTLKSATGETNYPTQITDPSGFFTATVTGLPNGVYSWRVKSPKFLANSGTVNLAGATQTNVEMGLMRVGDCNNDNVINVQDFNILKTTFGKALGDPGYDPRGDLNGDNAVSVQDFNLQKSNFGMSGSPPLRPVIQPQVRSYVKRPTGAMSWS
jgi:hypothetical protein